jgi:predicted nucleic acid-binding protein
MIRLFVDSSVLFSAAYSGTGYSRDILVMASRGEVTVVISDLVIEETRRNLLSFAPKEAAFFDLIITSLPFEFVFPTTDEVREAAHISVVKDAPILAAAKKARVDFLVTLDRKHLLNKPELSSFSGMPIATPEEVIRSIRIM